MDARTSVMEEAVPRSTVVGVVLESAPTVQPAVIAALQDIPASVPTRVTYLGPEEPLVAMV